MPKGIKGFQPGNKHGKKFTKGPVVSLKCLNCNIEFEVSEWRVRYGRKYCSTSCRSSYTMRKEKHWNWQGGISNRWDILHNSKEYKDWRMSVFKRDFFRCQKCSTGNSRKNKLHAHHIKPKSKHPDLILDIDNGITLCSNCHIDIHRSRH
jgi:5-methylcytosine-specific restriction endonuclease McrA